ncbi:hypothetical protein GCM10009720_09200 [Yaniella flava]|uniref:Uncharacterized protein n=1 Tax=Yaniella flava TaxID=287930 RepID=A0ABP5FP84_9MICC
MEPNVQSGPDNLVSATPRRHLGTMPGDNLMLPSDDVTVYTQIFYDFCEATGLEPHQLSSTRLSTVPIPRFTDRREISHMNATSWANPLFWLPQEWRINEEGYCNDTMSLRITWELSMANMYDPVDGFTDVLQLMGLDVDDPETQQRLYQWSAGASDPIFDSFDITGYLNRPDDQDEDWIADIAIEEIEDMLRASWYVNATGLTKMLDESVTEYENTADEIKLQKTIAAQLKLSAVLFDGLVYEDQDAKDVMHVLRPMLDQEGISAVSVAMVLREFYAYVEDANQPSVEYLVNEMTDEPQELSASDQ